ncbi:hypothetical protein [Dyadobacter sp. CY312]|uniref:hypothetical protein n=1 Tax=Dyadobacter sp. CY312 TaxID=2907303 RepID=UPI001F400B58|nr:hypothetical protein [Dyadobacter sp. CY312]MCE7044179.1 hypothetical protein [Dyadobacter sp. CY312]
MTHTLIIETENEKDFELIKGLTDRLGLPVKEQHAEELLEKQKRAFNNLVGSWEGDELADQIRSVRNDQPRDINL